jgi:hypothetical protein
MCCRHPAFVPSSVMANLVQATALRDTGTPGRYAIELDAEWTANGHCTAGYLMSVSARAVLDDVRATFPVPVAVGVRYARVTPPGPAVVEVDLLRTGTRRADWRVTLRTGDEPTVAALVSTGHPSSPDPGVPPPDLPDSNSCVLLPTRAPGFDLPVMAVLTQHADPSGLTWLAGEPSGKGLAQGWVQAADGSAPDVLSLLAAFDSLPTATYDLGLEGWAATVDLSVHVLGLPAPGPLRLRRRVHATSAHLVTLTCDIWDADAHHVATGVQLCALPA